VTPSRYPTWRSLAFAIAIILTLSLVVLFSRTGFGEFTRLSGSRPSILQLSVFGQAIIIAGALTLRSRPSLGFFIVGAGFLALAASLLVLLPWEKELVTPVAIVAVPGLGFTWLGVLERSEAS
jgi:hypothetical protein